MKKKYLFLLTLLWLSINYGADNRKPDPIKLLNWWDYLSKEAATNLKNYGYDLNVLTYKSNEVAISQLITNRKNIEIVIVSNQLIPLLLKDKIIYADIFKKNNRIDEYYDFFSTTVNHCIPYLWSTTVFVVNTKLKNLQPPTNFKQLKDLKNKNISIATIDDKFETLARLQSENQKTCPTNKEGYAFPSCDFNYLKKVPLDLAPSEFTTSISEILEKENTAAYGWHGEISPMVDYKTISVSLPDGAPIVSFDAICIVNNSYPKNRLHQLINFTQFLGKREMTKYNVNQTQYFSPFKNDSQNLRPKILQLFNNLNTKLSEYPAIIIHPPTPALHNKINTWWKSVRYGTK